MRKEDLGYMKQQKMSFGIKKNCKLWGGSVMEDEIMEKFLPINEQTCNTTIGKYSSKKKLFMKILKNGKKKEQIKII